MLFIIIIIIIQDQETKMILLIHNMVSYIHFFELGISIIPDSMAGYSRQIH